MAGSLAPLPKSRAEAILQNVLGDNNELETSKSRIEDLLKQLIGQSGGGSGGAFYVNFVLNNEWGCDRTFDEIKAAYDSGNLIVCVGGAQPAIMELQMRPRQASVFMARYVINEVSFDYDNHTQTILFSDFSIDENDNVNAYDTSFTTPLVAQS